MTAQAWITGEAPNQKINLRLPSGAKGKQGDPGPKGDPGGIVDGTLLGDTHLDSLRTSGVYQQADLAKGSIANGYPANAMAGVVIVHRTNDGRVHQTLKPANSPRGGNVIYQRTGTTASVTAPWQALPANRVDNTAGRAIYQWDDSAAREQLIYGDTGKRRIESTLINGWAGTYVSLRRQGNTVHIFGTGVNATASTSNIALILPTGFRVNGVNAAKVPIPGAFTGVSGTIPVPMLSNYSTGDFELVSTTAGGIIFMASWATNDPWPTTLPGVADGSIPNL